jgi:hypothetical protein
MFDPEKVVSRHVFSRAFSSVFYWLVVSYLQA